MMENMTRRKLLLSAAASALVMAIKPLRGLGSMAPKPAPKAQADPSTDDRRWANRVIVFDFGEAIPISGMRM